MSLWSQKSMACLHFRTATHHGNAVQALSHPYQGASSSIGVPMLGPMLGPMLCLRPWLC